MKKTAFILTGLLVFMTQWSLAGGTQYNLRVDGLACPFCAYGIEKKFSKTQGVETVDIDIQNGMVIVKTREGKTFSEKTLKRIVNDAGFTMKSFTENSL